MGISIKHVWATVGFLWFAGAPPALAQLGTESVTVKSPNGGECLIPGSEITVTWEGAGYDHVAITHRTDNNQPPTWQQDFSAWAPYHPIRGTSFKWTVPNITSNSVRLWIEAHNSAHVRLALDSSNNVFTISHTCGVDEPPSTTAPQVSQILVKNTVYQTSDTIEVPKGTDLTVVGTAGSSGAVTLYVGSEKKFTVTAEQDGKWTFDIFTHNLTEGAYQVDLETSGSPRTKAFLFTVIPLGQKPSTPPPSNTTVPPPTSTDTDGSAERTTADFPYLPVGITAGIAILGGTIVYLVIKHRGKRIDNTPTEPPTIT